MTPRRFLLTLLALAAASCGHTPLPAHFQAGVEHPKYPKKRYFVGAMSGDTPETAAANATADVASQVRSEITSVLSESSSALLSGSGPSTEATSIEQKVQIKAEFKHGELIRVVEKIRAGEPEQDWALAVLDRLEAAKSLETELAPALDEFNRAADGALGAAKDGRLKALFAARSEVADKYQKLLATGLLPQLAVVRGGAHPAQTGSRAKFDEVERAAREARASLVGLIVSRSLPGQADVPLATVDEALSKGFQAMGIKVETLRGGDPSPESPGDLRDRKNAVVARVDVDSSAKQSEMGLGVYFAYSNARVRLFRPSTAEVLADFSVGGPATKAGHRDEKKAIVNSMKYMLKELNERLEQELAALK